jgi:hypothetical protein
MNIFLVLFFCVTMAQPNPVAEWNRFSVAVRDQRISREAARGQFPAIFTALKEDCAKYSFGRAPSWIFPLRGYGIKDVGAGGFKPGIRYGSSPVKGYDFYDGNRHGGHPAYDIFIRDRDKDSLEDVSKRPVPVLAPLDLFILSAVSDWTPESGIRGGRYVWALDPLQDRIFYFAHLDEVGVPPGIYVKAGSEIGTVGRTGTNARPTRSPTHLHMMVLTVKGSDLIPYDYLRHLKN